ncbi:MAG: (Fe-S)-binding protein [Aigarchaeota archaeon]|nr:(Fe-S)-binding protein [Aigarchaeota archaeon]MDH5703289.1 (Fe-S)-binding protein [Aigarchaeota archaeon]
MRIREISDKIEICAYCPLMCQDICTVFAETKVQSRCPTMQQYILWLILNGRERYSEEVAEVMYECCCGCLLCQSWCATNQDVPEKVRAARSDLVELNLAPRSVLGLNESTLEFHNPYKEPHENRFENIGRDTSHRDRGAEILYFVGCTTTYRQPEIANAVITVLEHAKLDFRLLDGEEWCCGLPQWELGLERTARKLADHNSNCINRSGAKIVLTSCPECHYVLKWVYPSLGFPINAEIYHFSEYVNSLIKAGELSLKGGLDMRASYHDPCYLGRRAKVFDAPRDIMKSMRGMDFVDMRWTRDKAYCCGGNEGFAIIYPQLSARIGAKVMDEARKVEAQVVVTACPLCKELLVRHATDRHIEIFDLAELVNEVL